MGVAGASAGGAPVLVAGVAGLLAGSLSMALGEWLSVQSARELYGDPQILAALEQAGCELDDARKIGWLAGRNRAAHLAGWLPLGGPLQLCKLGLVLEVKQSKR